LMSKQNKKNIFRYSAIPAMCFIGLGLLVNQWLLALLFTSVVGQGIDTGNKIIIWLFQIFCISTGLLFYFRGNTPKQRKKLIFAYTAAAIMIITVEVMLQTANFVMVQLSDKEDVSFFDRSMLSPYKDKEWGKTLFKEYQETRPYEFKQYLIWAKGEYHGKYTNVNSSNVRKTWNPENFNAKPKTVYVFGGSTIWGFGARDDYTIPSQLSKLLNKNDNRFMVFNYGEAAYNFTQELVRLILLLRDGHRPDYVIFYNGVNDVYAAYQSGVAGITQNYLTTKKKVERKEPTPLGQVSAGLRELFKNHCMIYIALNNISDFIRQDKNIYQEKAARYNDRELKLLADQIAAHYTESADLLDCIAKTYDFEYICLWQPVLFLEPKMFDEERQASPRLKDQTLGNLFKYSNKAINQKNLPNFFNISSVLNDRPNLYYIDVWHLTEEGNSIVAKKIYDLTEKKFFPGK